MKYAAVRAVSIPHKKRKYGFFSLFYFSDVIQEKPSASFVIYCGITLNVCYEEIRGIPVKII